MQDALSKLFLTIYGNTQEENHGFMKLNDSMKTQKSKQDHLLHIKCSLLAKKSIFC